MIIIKQNINSSHFSKTRSSARAIRKAIKIKFINVRK